MSTTADLFAQVDSLLSELGSGVSEERRGQIVILVDDLQAQLDKRLAPYVRATEGFKQF